MLNARKREASDPLLPTRQPKYQRVEQSTLGGLATHPGLTARWTQLAREVVELASETIKAWSSRAPSSTSLPSRSPRLRRSALPPPRPRSRQVHTAPPSDTLPPSCPPIPNKSYPHKHHAQTGQASLPSSFPSDQYSMQTLLNPAHDSGSSVQSKSTTGFTSTLPHHPTGDDLLAESMQQCRKVEGISNTLSRRKSKEHIYARKVCFPMILITLGSPVHFRGT